MKSTLPANHGLVAEVASVSGLLPSEYGQPSLTDAQYDALAIGVARGESALISAPTSTGKTLIGWWTVASSIANGGRAVYLVSHRALAKQKFDEVQRLFLDNLLNGDEASIVCATGDSVEDASGRKTNSPLAATVLIATYEKYLGCLSTGGPPRDLRDVTFVCDEVQLIGDKTRGKSVELLLTLLKRSGWKQFVGLSAVMSERDATSLAAWLQLKSVRNPTREKALRISCRTPNQVHTMIAAPGKDGDWQDDIVRRATDVIGIVEELVSDQTQKPVIIFCMKVDDTFGLAAALASRRNQSITVSVPPGIDIDTTLLSILGKKVAFHNAELSEDERLFVEARLASGDIDAVFATSTLAAGVNFPLGSAVFAGWKRWNFDRRAHLPIGRAEFQNMAGRVGRMGQAATEGNVILTAAAAADAQVARQLMDLRTQEDLGTGITPADFGPLILQIFAGSLCTSRDEAFDLLTSTLSAARELERNRAGLAHWRKPLDSEVDRLVATGCLLEGSAKVVVTSLGLAVARSGLKPETALYFIGGLLRYAQSLIGMLPDSDDGAGEDDLSFILTHAALASPEFTYQGGSPTRHLNWRVANPGLLSNHFARRLEVYLFEQPWMADVGAANGALALTAWVSGKTRQEVEGVIPSVRLGTTQAMARDVAWVLTGISEIVSAVTSRSLADESKPPQLRGEGGDVMAVRQLARAMRRQGARINAGLPSDSLWLASLDLQGAPRRLSRSQIVELRKEGLAKAINLMSGDESADQSRRRALGEVVGSRLSNAVRDAARRWKVEDRAYCKKLHLRRAEKFNASGIIERIYTARGNSYEEAFEAGLNFAAISFQALDRSGRVGYPDYLVNIEDYPSLVFELKTRQSDGDFVSFNNATEVLAASELIGLKENFCVTLCNPAIDPSVPALIERCARLCVLDSCDLAEALLRVREGSLTRGDLYNWITTPGIALREDLPPSH